MEPLNNLLRMRVVCHLCDRQHNHIHDLRKNRSDHQCRDPLPPRSHPRVERKRFREEEAEQEHENNPPGR